MRICSVLPSSTSLHLFLPFIHRPPTQHQQQQQQQHQHQHHRACRFVSCAFEMVATRRQAANAGTIVPSSFSTPPDLKQRKERRRAASNPKPPPPPPTPAPALSPIAPASTWIAPSPAVFAPATKVVSVLSAIASPLRRFLTPTKPVALSAAPATIAAVVPSPPTPLSRLPPAPATARPLRRKIEDVDELQQERPGKRARIAPAEFLSAPSVRTHALNNGMRKALARAMEAQLLRQDALRQGVQLPPETEAERRQREKEVVEYHNMQVRYKHHSTMAAPSRCRWGPPSSPNDDHERMLRNYLTLTGRHFPNQPIPASPSPPPPAQFTPSSPVKTVAPAASKKRKADEEPEVAPAAKREKIGSYGLDYDDPLFESDINDSDDDMSGPPTPTTGYDLESPVVPHNFGQGVRQLADALMEPDIAAVDIASIGQEVFLLADKLASRSTLPYLDAFFQADLERAKLFRQDRRAWLGADRDEAYTEHFCTIPLSAFEATADLLMAPITF